MKSKKKNLIIYLNNIHAFNTLKYTLWIFSKKITSVSNWHTLLYLCPYGLLHIKINDKWLNNINPWILNACCCNHDLKFIVGFGKGSKALIYYITDYIMKTTNFTSHMYSLMKIGVQKVEETHPQNQFK
jgi:hypothetical protein